MENKEKEKPGQQDQNGDRPKGKKEQSKAKLPLSPQEEEERDNGLEKTHRSEHQPLPGEGTDEAKGKADDESEED